MRFASNKYIDRVLTTPDSRKLPSKMFGGEHQNIVLSTHCSPTFEEQSFIHPSGWI